MRKMILASTSSRRKQLLEQIGLEFEVVPSAYEEDMSIPLAPTELAKQLAYGKASEVADRYPDAIVLGADTVIAFRDSVLGKPKDTADAKRILGLLSGNTHQVITGVVVICRATDQSLQAASVTTVEFSVLSKEDIARYVTTGEPMDKAGAYAIQGLAAKFIPRIEGEYSNVMGLPLSLVWQLLKQIA